MPSGALEGRIAAITGAGRGIGRHYALLFAAEAMKDLPPVPVSP